MNQLTTLPVSEVDLAQAFDILASIPAENLWLANFTSSNTKQSYRRSVVQFIATMGIDNPDALYSVSQGHVIAYRDHLKASGASKATIANRLSALSSLYKFLADKQLCTVNPVSGVMRLTPAREGWGAEKPQLLPPSKCGPCWTRPILTPS